MVGFARVPPIFPGPSFDLTGIVTGFPIVVIELSFVATGGLIPDAGSKTVIVNNSVGQGKTIISAHTGTS